MRLSTSLALMGCLIGVSALPALATVRKVPSQYPTIQAAINAAQPGDTVQVSPKTGSDPAYHESVVISTPSLTLQGVLGATLDGKGTSFLLDPFGQGPFPYQHDAILVQADNVLITGLTIKNFLYETDPFDQSPLFFVCGIRLRPVQNTRIVNNKLINVYYGLDVDGSLNTNVAGNTIQGCVAAGIFSDSTATVIQNNTITNNLNVADAYGVLNTGAGLSVSTGGCQVLNNEIANNGSGLSIGNPDGSVSGNNVVQGNNVHNNLFDGISATFGGTTIIRQNTVSSNGIGIHLNSTFGATVSQNVVTGNVGEAGSGGNQPNAGDGIFVEGFSSLDFPAGNLISQNVLVGNHGAGIHIYAISFFGLVEGSEGNTMRQNVASGNSLFDAEDDTFDGTRVYNSWIQDVVGTTNPSGLH